MTLTDILADDEQPISVTVKRPGPPSYDELGQPIPGALVEVATTTRASIQPVSSETVQREAGRETKSTHELFCPVLDIQPDDLVEVTYTKTGARETYRVNGRPQDWGTHLEVTLVWQGT